MPCFFSARIKKRGPAVWLMSLTTDTPGDKMEVLSQVLRIYMLIYAF